MTLTLTGPGIAYTHTYTHKNNNVVITVYNHRTKTAYRLLDGYIQEDINTPFLTAVLHKYEIVPYEELPNQLDLVKQYARELLYALTQKKEIKPSCDNCKHHNYDYDIDDGYYGEEYEICEKGNDLEGPCNDWEKL
ncbi:MAG: hypothetical protein IJP99_08425 [Methanobrevibacter sp.]|nr:hypothetical protein [Methanobrevibacter sp.]